jgi:hypothetical protein
MNIKVKEGIYSVAAGNKFFKLETGFIRGNNINSVQFKEGLLEKLEEVKEQEQISKMQQRIINK